MNSKDDPTYSEEDHHPTALWMALHAVLVEAKALGFDIDAICKKATYGMTIGSKPYRGGSALWEGPAAAAIKDALATAHEG